VSGARYRRAPLGRIAACALLAVLVPVLGVLRAAGAAPQTSPSARAAAPSTRPAANVVLPETYDLVDVWDPTLPTAVGRLYHPEGLDVSADGLVAVAERGNNLISLWYADGESVGRWGAAGSLPGQFDPPEISGRQ